MKKFLLAVLAALTLGAASARADDNLTLQLKWVTQAQFAGYYVALAKGYYKAQGLNVTIKPGGPDVAPEQVLAGGGADVVVDWMPSALAAREKGLDIVNIAQVFQHSGLELTCRKDSGVATPATSKAKPSASGSPATNTRSCPGWPNSTSPPVATTRTLPC